MSTVHLQFEVDMQNTNHRFAIGVLLRLLEDHSITKATLQMSADYRQTISYVQKMLAQGAVIDDDVPYVWGDLIGADPELVKDAICAVREEMANGNA